ncbi:MAG TPA: farnesyl diphosphate synthase [Halanaerobiales bacterium]|nr:farnesyl diphosphate synthase [Halanaerobiales bacterium]
MNNIKRIMKEYSRQLEQFMEQLFDGQEHCSEKLTAAMKYSLFSGGKRLRPTLTRLVTEMLEGDTNAAIFAGAALEMIHSYSLIHDDLPSMDDDDLRRGKASNHVVFGEALAILAGDGLLTYSFNILSKLSLPPENTLKIIEIISKGAGPEGMVGGQVLDLEGEDKELKLSELKKIHRAKTGALFRSSVMAGAYCASPSEQEMVALKNFSEYLGVTFQIVDDILDLTGDEEETGKKVGSDERLNKATYPRLLGLEEARKEAEYNGDKARESLEPFGEKANNLKELVDYIVIRRS